MQSVFTSQASVRKFQAAGIRSVRESEALQFGSDIKLSLSASASPPKKYVVKAKPKPRKWLIRALAVPNRLWLRHAHGVSKVHIQGEEKVKTLLEGGHRVILTPNHPGNGDVYLSHAMAESLGTPLNIIVADWFFKAWDFLPEKLRHAYLTRRGMFPVNRETNDLEAIKTAVEVVKEGKFPFLIFPEGLESYKSDVVGNINPGAAHIGLMAAKQIKSSGSSDHVFTVPVGLKYRFKEDILGTLDMETERLEFETGLRLPGQGSKYGFINLENLSKRLETVWIAGLHKLESRFCEDVTTFTNLEEYHQAVQTNLLNVAAKDLGEVLDGKEPLLKRIRQLQAHIVEARPIPGKDFKTEKERQAFLKERVHPILNSVYALFKLEPGYHREALTQLRLAEVLYTLDCGLHGGQSGVMKALGMREFYLAYGEPIDVTAQMETAADKQSLKQGITDQLKTSLQGLVDGLKKALETPKAE